MNRVLKTPHSDSTLVHCSEIWTFSPLAMMFLNSSFLQFSSSLWWNQEHRRTHHDHNINFLLHKTIVLQYIYTSLSLIYAKRKQCCRRIWLRVILNQKKKKPTHNLKQQYHVFCINLTVKTKLETWASSFQPILKIVKIKISFCWTKPVP